MSEATYDSVEGEAYEGEAYEGEGEAYEGEAFEGEAAYEAYGEDYRSDQAARRRAILKARNHSLARRTPAGRQMSRPRPVPPTAAPRPAPATINAVRAVELDGMVSRDSLRRQLERANRRAQRSTYSALATSAVSQALDTYEDNLKEHPFVRAAIRWAPNAILPADKERKGIEAIALHPAFLSGALIGGIFLVGRFTNPDKTARSVEITSPGTLLEQETGTLLAKAVDGNGRTVSGLTFTWRSSDANILAFPSETSGAFQAGWPGLVTVTVSAGGAEESVAIRVQPDQVNLASAAKAGRDEKKSSRKSAKR